MIDSQQLLLSGYAFLGEDLSFAPVDIRIENGVLKGRVVGSPGPGMLFLMPPQQHQPAYIPVPVVVESAAPPQLPKAWSPPHVPAGRHGRLAESNLRVQQPWL